jgi:transcriptional regulator with GAF, ATPase, and Fis domain
MTKYHRSKETWPELRERHKEEKRRLIETCAKANLTITEASRMIDIDMGQLRTEAWRYNIQFLKRYNDEQKTAISCPTV